MQNLIFATHNSNKTQEVERMLDSIYLIKDLNSIGITEEIPETGDTLDENARQKARYVHSRNNCNVFADDTGLEVEALNGQPGTHTARYAGPECDSSKNIAKLLNAMDGVHNRRAQFRTVICLILGNSEYLFEGIVKGTIATELSGNGGFGYDPVFIPDGYDKTFAEMTLEEKNKISHRGQAISKLAKFLISLE